MLQIQYEILKAFLTANISHTFSINKKKISDITMLSKFFHMKENIGMLHFIRWILISQDRFKSSGSQSVVPRLVALVSPVSLLQMQICGLHPTY